MNVLSVEDRGSTAYNVDHWLRGRGHTVLAAFNPNDAQSHWQRRGEVPVHCIMLDLQMEMDGLTQKQKLEAEGGTLAGWVWLRDNVLVEVPEMRRRTIIYSDHVDVLRERVPEEQLMGIKVIPKRLRSTL